MTGRWLLQLMFLSVLSSKLPADASVGVIAVHPGIVSTNILVLNNHLSHATTIMTVSFCYLHLHISKTKNKSTSKRLARCELCPVSRRNHSGNLMQAKVQLLQFFELKNLLQ